MSRVSQVKSREKRVVGQPGGECDSKCRGICGWSMGSTVLRPRLPEMTRMEVTPDFPGFLRLVSLCSISLMEAIDRL